MGERTHNGRDAMRQRMAEAYRQPPRFRARQMIAEGGLLAAMGEVTPTDAAGNAAEHAYCDAGRRVGGKLAALRAFVVKAGTTQ